MFTIIIILIIITTIIILLIIIIIIVIIIITGTSDSGRPRRPRAPPLSSRDKDLLWLFWFVLLLPSLAYVVYVYVILHSGTNYRTPEIDTSEIVMDCKRHFPMSGVSVVQHFPTQFHLSVAFTKGL